MSQEADQEIRYCMLKYSNDMLPLEAINEEI